MKCLKLLVRMGVLIHQMRHCNPALYVLVSRVSINHAINPLIDGWVEPTSETENQLRRPREPQTTNQQFEPINIDIKSTALLVVGGAL